MARPLHPPGRRHTLSRVWCAVVLWVAALVAALAGLLRDPRAGRLTRSALAALALACLALSAVEGGTLRDLEVVHEQPAFVGNQVQSKEFLVETVTAKGYAHGLVAAGFCALLAMLAFAGLPARAPLLWQIVLAWLGIACALALEKTAAPPATVALRLHGTVWLAALGLSVALAQQTTRLSTYGAALWVLVNLLWLPAPVFGAIATRGALGTSLDVHGIEFCADRFAGTPLTLAPGSWQQIWHLLVQPLLLVFPCLCWLSAGGVGFLLLMARRERQRISAAAAQG